jgi:hypothetical protein
LLVLSDMEMQPEAGEKKRFAPGLGSDTNPA